MIRYRLTANPQDFHRAQALLRAEGRSARGRWYYPTVLATEGVDLVAALGTALMGGLVVLGPLVLARRLGMRRGAVVAYRMAARWEEAAAGLGVTAYYMRIPPGMAQWRRSVERLGYVPVEAPEDPGHWYRRVIGPWGATRQRDRAQPVGNGFMEVPADGWLGEGR